MTPYELAALVGAATPITRPFAQRAAQLFFRLLRPATDRGGAELADFLFPEGPAGTDVPSLVVHWKARNTALVLVRARAIMDDEKIEVREVPRSWVLPLLDVAGNVEDPDLQEMWARLLASGVAADEHRHPMWVKILAQMSAEDARAFARVCSEADELGVPYVDGTPGFDSSGPEVMQMVRLVALGVAMPVRTAASLNYERGDDGPDLFELDLAAAPTRLGAQFRRAVMAAEDRGGRTGG